MGCLRAILSLIPSIILGGIHTKATYNGNQRNLYLELARNSIVQIVEDDTVKLRKVAGVDQNELLNPEKLADSDSSFFKINGVRVHYKICHHEADEEEKGKTFRVNFGFPMILLHGFAASTFSWNRVMSPLAQLIGSKVLAFDRPAFGLTSRPSYIEMKGNDGFGAEIPLNPYSSAFSVQATLSFIDMLGAGKVILMGHSAGCFVALNAYFDSPQKVAAMILIAPAILAPLIIRKGAKSGEMGKERKAGCEAFYCSRILHNFRKFFVMIVGAILEFICVVINLFSSIFVKAVAAVIRSAFSIMLVRIITDIFGITVIKKSWYDASLVTDDVIQGYVKPLKVKEWDRALLEFVLALLIGSASKTKLPLSNRLSEIKCPVLIVTGDTDRIIPSWNVKRLAQAIPDTTFEVIENCGHLPHEEKFEEFISTVHNFLYTRFALNSISKGT